jgi:NADPH:quinone reductase-like Zn-dependent oxidoreductase
MKAIVITAYGGPEMLSVAELPDPVPAAGEVLIRVRAFGLNHAETYMRSGAWGTVAQVPGIECAGTVQADPNGRVDRVGRAAPEPRAAAGADRAGPGGHLRAGPGRREHRC